MSRELGIYRVHLYEDSRAVNIALNWGDLQTIEAQIAKVSWSPDG